MSYEIQSMLLRVLQESTYTPIGSGKERVADVRIITATNEDLQQAIKDGRFREDLYHRLNEFEIRQPSLAECPEDIIPLAEFFRERHSKELKRATSGFTEDAKCRMLSYSWPGNVRDLQNRVKRAVLLASSPLLTCQDLGLDTIIESMGSHRGKMPEADEKERVGKALMASGGNVSRAAESLGISRVTLYKKMRKYGLE